MKLNYILKHTKKMKIEKKSQITKIQKYKATRVSNLIEYQIY